MEKIAEFELGNTFVLDEKLSSFAKGFTYSAVLLSNGYADKYGKYEFLAAFGAYRILRTDTNSLLKLKEFHEQRRSWLFGHFSYELKNEIKGVQSKKAAKHEFSSLSFFEPAYLLLQERGSKVVKAFVNEDANAQPLLELIKDLQHFSEPQAIDFQFPLMQSDTTKESYVECFEDIKTEIAAGNIQGLNFCQQFSTIDKNFDPYLAFTHLNKRSSMPFAAFYKNQSAYAIAASPERFMCKRANQLISQPIKGTIKRGTTAEEDEQYQNQLKSDLKEQAENQMIVDLVAEDLKQTAVDSSVKVEELFGVYTFPQLHQLISTLSSELSPQHHWTAAIQHAFPMGSMTGVPKKIALQMIDNYENSRRELYSGAIGYIKADGDFDFNVVIRTLLYNAKTNFLSYSVGGAITAAAKAENEYEECLLKAKAIFESETED